LSAITGQWPGYITYVQIVTSLFAMPDNFIILLCFGALLFELKLKTWLQLNMGQDRLVGLWIALLNIYRHRIHRDIQIDEVIDMFAATKKRNILYRHYRLYIIIIL